MPTAPSAPTLETERIRSRPLSIPAAQPDLRVAKGVADVADALQKAEVQKSQIRLSEAEGEVIRRWNATSFEDEDAYFKLRGKSAVDALDDRFQALDDIANDISDNQLKSGHEKRIFNDALRPRREMLRIKMATHSFDERQRWDKETAASNIKTQVEAAANDPSVENLRFTKARIEDEAAAIARVDGLPPEQTQEMIDGAVSAMYRKAIESAMLTDLQHANELFARFGEDILSADRKTIGNSLRERTITVASIQQATQIRFNGGSLESQLAAADRIKNDEVREETRRRVANAFNQEETARREVIRDTYQALGSDVLNGATVDDIRSSVPDAWDIITQEQKEHLKALEAAQGTVKVTNWGRWSELVLMAPNDLAQMHPMDERLNLADEQYKQFVNMVRDARSGSLGPDSISVRTPYQRLSNAVGGAKKLTKDKGQLMAQELNERLLEFNTNNGRNPNPVELDEIVSRLIVDVELPARQSRIPILRALLPDPDRQVFQIAIEDVPEQFQRDAVDAFQRKFNRLPSDNEIIDLYGLQLSKDAE